MKKPGKETLDELLAFAVAAAGHKAALREIGKHGGSTYGADPKDPSLIIERSADGTKRRGKFVNRVFVPLE